MSAFEVTKVDTVEEFAALKPVWNKLVDAGDHPNAFLTFEWLFSWWESFGSKHELYILVVRTDGEIVALAPLMLARANRRGAVIRFIGAPESDYSDFLSTRSQETTPVILDYLMQHRRDWTGLNLEQMSERSSTVALIAAYFESGRLAYQFRPSETCHTLHYEGDDEKRENFAPRRNKTLKWSINFFKRSGTLALSELKTSDEIEPWLDYLFHYHLMRWKDTVTPSKFADPAHREHYRRMIRNLAGDGRLSLLLLKHDELPIAFQFNFLYRRSVFVYTLAHNVFFRRQSPGKILNHLAVEHYIRAGYDELDFTRGGESYKGSLTNQTYANYQLKVYRGRVRYWLSCGYDGLKASRWVGRLARSDSVVSVKNRLVAAYDEHGLSGPLKVTLSSVWRRLWDWRPVIVMKHRGDRQEQGAPSFIVPEKVDRKSLVSIASLYGVAEDSPRGLEFAHRFDIGQDCFVASNDGRMVGAVWGFRHELRLAEVGQQLLDHRQVMLADAFVAPTTDAASVLPILLSYAVEHYRRRDYTVTIACADCGPWDIDALKDAGFTPSHKKYSLRILGARLV